jgi:hypothetical protein
LTDKSVISDKPPLWVVLTSATKNLLVQKSYPSAQFLSLIFGLLINLPLVYSLARNYSNRTWSLLSLLIYATSYLTIDFSGNGSRYMLQTLLILILLHALINQKLTATAYTITTSLLTGLLFLVNYTAALALLVIYLGLFLRKQLSPITIVVSLFTFAAIISPWLIYNYFYYDTPLLATNLSVIEATGNLRWEENKVLYDLHIGENALLTFLKSLPRYLFSNSVFFVKKLLVLLPLLSIFLLIIPLKIKHLLSHPKPTLLLALTICHTFSFLSWRVFKFRYFVSIFPLLLLLGLVAISYLKPKIGTTILSATLVLTIAISIAVYYQNPFHTYYYDGVFTKDQFRGTGEVDHMITMTQRHAFAKNIPDAVVATTIDRAYFLDSPSYLFIPVGIPENFHDIVTTYNIDYLWLDEPLDQSTLDQFPELSLIDQQPGEVLYLINHQS